MFSRNLELRIYNSPSIQMHPFHHTIFSTLYFNQLKSPVWGRLELMKNEWWVGSRLLWVVSFDSGALLKFISSLGSYRSFCLWNGLGSFSVMDRSEPAESAELAIFLFLSNFYIMLCSVYNWVPPQPHPIQVQSPLWSPYKDSFKSRAFLLNGR